MNESILWPGLLAIKASLIARLTAWGNGLPGQIYVAAGERPAWDFDGKTEMAWVHAVSMYESQSFPQPANPGMPCGGPITAQINVAVIRCAPVPKMSTTGSVTLPTAQQQEDSAAKLIADMRAIYEALTRADVGDLRLSLGQYSPVGPSGGMVGGSWSAFLGE